MRLIVGLGNPGEKYENTRHNVGFMVADRLQTTVYSGCEWEESGKLQAVVCRARQANQVLRAGRPKAVDVLLAKPKTFMNESGKAVKALANFFKVEPSDLWIIHDDLDIKLGEYKIQKGKGPKLHNGVLSIENALGTKDFWRVRVGVENRISGGQAVRQSGEEYVLEDFINEELEILKKVFGKIVEDLTKLIS